MTKTYAAFYMPSTKIEKPKTNYKLSEKISNVLSGACRKAKKAFSISTITNIADNMSIESATELTQLYAAGALTKIINGAPINSRTMLDSLFNTYAPVLNASLLQNGYNSLNEMRVAVQAGNINVSQFIEGFSDALTAVNKIKYEKQLAKYGEEIPIDVVSKCEYRYNVDSTDKQVKNAEHTAVSSLKRIKLILTAHIKNKNAELWSLHDIMNKIGDLMHDQKSFTFRVGKEIYENCLITRFEPTITNIYDLSFIADIYFPYESNTFGCTQSRDNKTIINPTQYVGDFDKDLKNLMNPLVDKGIITT